MNVVEIKNNLVKIAYESEENIALSSFVIIEDGNMPYVAQVMNLKSDENGNFAIVKLLFTFNEEGVLKNYNGTVPALASSVTLLPAKELLDVIPVEDPLYVGKLAQVNIPVRIDKSVFESNLLICSSNVENTELLISNFVKQIDEKIVIIDTEGMFHSDNKIMFPRDFKLPLNYEMINYIYDNDLNDVDAVNKAIIQDIFLEVQNYTRTLPDKFLPFDTFFGVVEQQYQETQIPQLVLLKNKLLKYKEEGIFALNKDDIFSLNNAVQSNDPVIIDISNAEDSMQKELITYIYGVLSDYGVKLYSFVKLSNDNSDKKLLRLLTSRDNNIFTTIICRHENKYIAELKEIAQNLILFTPQTLQHDFLSYNTFLNKLSGTEFVVFGEHTQNIPFIIELSEFSKEDLEKVLKEPSVEDVTLAAEDNSVTENSQEQVDEQAVSEDLSKEEDLTGVEEKTEEPIVEEISEQKDDSENEVSEENKSEEPVVEVLNNDTTEQDSSAVDDTLTSNEEDFEVLTNDDETPVEASSDETVDVPVQETVSEQPQSNQPEQKEKAEEIPSAENSDFVKEEKMSQNISDDELVDQIAKDVDKMLYEKVPTNDELEPEIVDDALTEDDLNLIDDLSDEDDAFDENIEEVSVEEEQVVPIYLADDISDVEVPSFEPGDKVSTPKYGEGVVEKMIKYGNKMLCSIDFPNIGRRLLDPAMTEIKKLS